MRRPTPHPTEVELAILQTLWRLGQGTVRAVQEALGPDESPGYTSVLKMLQVMHEKGLVTREAEGKGHVYRPVPSREATQKGMLRDLLRRAFGGNAKELVAMAIEDDHVSEQERAEIAALLAQTKRRKS